MAINTKCAKQSLILDYTLIGIIIGVIGLVVLCVFAIFNAAKDISPIIFPAITAESILIVTESAILCFALIWISRLDKSDVPPDKITTPLLVLGVGIVLLFPMFGYLWFSNLIELSGGYQLPLTNLSLIVGTAEILNLILTPFAVAYARCKE